jgi:hypothetical protein
MAFRSVRRLKADAFSVFRNRVHIPSKRLRFPPYESVVLVPRNDTWDKYRWQHSWPNGAKLRRIWCDLLPRRATGISPGFHSWPSREYRKRVSYQTQGAKGNSRKTVFFRAETIIIEGPSQPPRTEHGEPPSCTPYAGCESGVQGPPRCLDRPSDEQQVPHLRMLSTHGPVSASPTARKRSQTISVQKSAVSGSGPIRPSLRSREAIFARSSESNEKSDTSKFSRMRDGVTDFGITT